MARGSKKNKKKRKSKKKRTPSSGSGGGGGGTLLGLRGSVKNAASGKSRWVNWVLWIVAAIVLAFVLRKYLF